jgi:hypothetical protein
MTKVKAKKRKFKCHDCGTLENTKRTTCPFADEIYNKVLKVTLCPKCYHDRLMDI